MKLKIFTILFLGVSFLLPVSVQAAHIVPGEVPKVQPLQPIDAGAKPNYAGSVNYTSHPNDKPKSDADQQPQAVPAPGQIPVPPANHSWVWALVLIILVIAAAVAAWWKFARKTPSVLVMILILPLASILISPVALNRTAQAKAQAKTQSAAQNLEPGVVDRAPTQRTIEEIDPSTNKPVGQATTTEVSQQQASTSVIYGLGGIILLLIAIGIAIYLMKSEKDKPVKKSPAKLR